MDFNDDKDLDSALRTLGQGTPFSVDWRDYDARLGQRLLERERTSARMIRRMSVAYAACGAFAGAALTAAALYVFVLSPLQFNRSASIAAPIAAVEVSSNPPTQIVSGAGTATYYKQPAQAAAAPFQTDIVRADGSLGKIRFEGFSSSAETGWIAAHSNTR